MPIEMSPGEVFDRYTILRMKSVAIKDPALRTEVSKFSKEVERIFESDLPTNNVNIKLNRWNLTKFLLEIMEANAKIWVLEAAIRQEVRGDPEARPPNTPNGDLSYEEIGRRTIAIRDYNRRRVAAKGSIDKLFGVFPDVKVDHASE